MDAKQRESRRTRQGRPHESRAVVVEPVEGGGGILARAAAPWAICATERPPMNTRETAGCRAAQARASWPGVNPVCSATAVNHARRSCAFGVK